MTTLVALAERYLALTQELEQTRSAMKAILMNGSGGDPPHPTNGSQPRGASQNRFAEARAKDEELVELLRAKPIRTGEITKAMNAKTSTISERLRRLRAKGVIEPCEDGGWMATATHDGRSRSHGPRRKLLSQLVKAHRRVRQTRGRGQGPLGAVRLIAA